jgi:hypothetical protein
MPTLNESFADDQIISHLCKERLKLAASTNDRQYISRLVGDVAEAQSDGLLSQLLPSRRQWSRHRPRHRRSGLNPDLLALKNTVRALRHQSPAQPWVNELNRFIGSVQARVLGSEPFALTPPDIQCQLKKEHEYRALCRFGLEDNLILCLFARYLRGAVDSQFSAASFAFRARRAGRTTTHHDAFNAIYNIQREAPNRSLYVAECDIRGFFDAVDYGVALAAYREAASTAGLDIRAEQIFRAYLNCYSFPVNVLAEAGPRLRERDGNGYFPWPVDALQTHHSDPHTARIGVPQGGAISGVIANLILDRADKAVERVKNELGAEIHYLRFCDDMVLISPVKQHCQLAFDAYLAALHNLKLPFHLPQRTIKYSKCHWANKSKAPYCWSGQQWFGSVPWVQFVGYQVRYDGLVRPKPASVEKEVKKLRKKTAQLKFGLLRAGREHPILATRDQASASLKHRLVAQGVGRIKGGERSGPKPMSWAAGFKALHNKPFVSRALRLLDRTRLKQIRSFDTAAIRYGLGRNSRGGHGRDPVGYAFSYYAQFTNALGQELINNPWRPTNYKDVLKQFIYLLVSGWFINRWRKRIWSKIAHIKRQLLPK